MAGRIGAAVLRRFDAETAHGLAIRALKHDLVPPCPVADDPRLRVTIQDLTFPNPIGMAAGFDKNAEVPDGLLALGFGFAEVGTLTPKAQAGNPKPRIFRLPEHEAVVNRLGFNNDGHDPAFVRLSARHGRPGIVGINVGANKDSQDRAGDYVTGITRFARLAGYLCINVSSPNTPGLRDLQARDALDDLLARSVAARDATIGEIGRRVPLFLKIAPDQTEAGLDDIVAVALARGIDGLVVSNTTVTRDGVAGHPLAGETGGLSGRPLFDLSTRVLAKVRRRVGPAMPLIGVGGVSDGADAFEKIAAGADLVQLYTGFIYGGSGTAARIRRDLSALVGRTGLASLAAHRDSGVDRWADRPL